jgi:hypothetical protein
MSNVSTKREIAFMTLEDLLDVIQDAAVALRPGINGKALTPHPSGSPFAMMITRDELREIVRKTLLTPFKTNLDLWDQGYDVGRTTGSAEGHESACAKFADAIDCIRATAEQFRAGAPWRVTGSSSRYYVTGSEGSSVAQFEYESDAQAVADVLNATIAAAKAVA